MYICVGLGLLGQIRLIVCSALERLGWINFTIAKRFVY